MPKDEVVANSGADQHQKRCPSCRSPNTVYIGISNFMGCDNCGHMWVGKDFKQDEEG